jgi:hypothetical protein
MILGSLKGFRRMGRSEYPLNWLDKLKGNKKMVSLKPEKIV